MNPAGSRLAKMLLALMAVLPLAACAPSATGPAPASEGLTARQAYVVGGHVTGLQGIGLSLRTSRGEAIHIDDDGKFVFGARLDDGSDYVVTVGREPISPVQSCVVEGGAGTIAARNAMHITVVCSTIALDAEPADTQRQASR